MPRLSNRVTGAIKQVFTCFNVPVNPTCCNAFAAIAPCFHVLFDHLPQDIERGQMLFTARQAMSFAVPLSTGFHVVVTGSGHKEAAFL